MKNSLNTLYSWYIKPLFCKHKFKFKGYLDETETYAHITLFGNVPIAKYECTKCGKIVYR